jgi:restriction system protein
VLGGSRDWEREQRRVTADLERERRAAERERLAAEKAARQTRVIENKDRALRRTEELEERLTALRSVLANGLRSAAAVDIDELRRWSETVPLELGDLAEPISHPAVRS